MREPGIAETASGRKWLRFAAALAVLAFALFLLSRCQAPGYNDAQLKAVRAESEVLMANHKSDDFADLPKSQWPPAIASLKPEWVMVNRDRIDIVTKPFFDGGWGYYVPLDDRKPPEPAGRYSKLRHGIYWFHPY